MHVARFLSRMSPHLLRLRPFHRTLTMRHASTMIPQHYHNETKHHFNQQSKSLSYLDWANQPYPFRRFKDKPVTLLHLQHDKLTPMYDDDFFSGKKIPSSPLDFFSLSQFFRHGMSISDWKMSGNSKWPLRVNPSSGNLHPTESYVILPAMNQVNSKPGVYHYAPDIHGLERLNEFPATSTTVFSEDVHFLVGLSSIYWREAWKYGERAFRYCQHDTGHALMALWVSARMLGWDLVPFINQSDESISELLGLNKHQNVPELEREFPELLAYVKPLSSATLSDPYPLLNKSSMSDLQLHPNRLSNDHVSWPIIEKVHQATLKPKSHHVAYVPKPSPSFKKSGARFTAGELVHRRRSAVAMDGETAIEKKQFFNILRRVADPIQCLGYPPQVHLFLFVHRVNGLKPGLYSLVRNDQHLQDLKTNTRNTFAWELLPDAKMPLYLLAERNVQELASQLSCHQDIAGSSCFSLGMIARFDEALDEYGDWMYKRLFWESGCIGQLLYLESEAIEISATGIGCYFDDPVHELFGFKNTKYQSLYHFTCGGSVIDNRITSLPPYERISVSSINKNPHSDS